jgi:hypothetical protein
MRANYTEVVQHVKYWFVFIETVQEKTDIPEMEASRKERKCCGWDADIKITIRKTRRLLFSRT